MRKAGHDRRASAAACAGLTLALAPSLALASGDGSPQLIPYFPHLFVLVAFFVVLVFPVDHFLLRPLLRVLDERREQISGARARADKLAAAADEVLERYENSVREVRDDAEAERKQLLGNARSDAAQRAAELRAEIEREIEGARSSVRSSLEQARSGLDAQARELAREVAARVLGRDLA